MFFFACLDVLNGMCHLKPWGLVLAHVTVLINQLQGSEGARLKNVSRILFMHLGVTVLRICDCLCIWHLTHCMYS